MEHEIAEQIAEAERVKARFGYTDTAEVHRTWLDSRRSCVGFNFRQGGFIGEAYLNGDGDKVEVLALV